MRATDFRASLIAIVQDYGICAFREGAAYARGDIVVQDVFGKRQALLLERIGKILAKAEVGNYERP